MSADHIRANASFFMPTIVPPNGAVCKNHQLEIDRETR